MKPFLAILFFFACLYAFVKFFGPIPLATSSDQNVFTVQGTGEASGNLQTATVTLGVSKSATTPQVAQQEVNTIANQVIADLKSMNIQSKNIKTTDYSSSPNYPQQTPQQYTVSENLEISSLSIDQANTVIDTATKDGATDIGGVQYQASNANQTDLENQARTKAIANAKQKAVEISKESGLRLGQLINVEEDTPGGPIVFNAEANSVAKTVPNPVTNLQPGQNNVTVNVTLTYQTY